MHRRLLTVVAIVAGMISTAVILQSAELPQEELDPKKKPVQLADKSVTVFPIVLTTDAKTVTGLSQKVGEVVGMLLERAGMDEVELATSLLEAGKQDDMATVTSKFCELVRQHPVTTEYALFGQIVGQPNRGVEEIRTVIVDREGKLVFRDCAGPGDFARTEGTKPKDPMTSCVFLVNRLRGPWNLGDPLREDAPRGKVQAKWRKETGVPSEEEFAAIEARRRQLASQANQSTLAVYPVRIAGTTDRVAAKQLANLLGTEVLSQVIGATPDPQLTIQGDPNQQKVLWDTARMVRKFVQEHPPETDYVLYADYGISHPGTGTARVHYVHVVVCDKSGQWVLVDFQNSHHADFQQMESASTDACHHLVATRLRRRLAE